MSIVISGNFDIRPYDRARSISPSTPTEWTWNVTPYGEGPHRLSFLITAHLTGGESRVVRTATSEIQVQVPRTVFGFILAFVADYGVGLATLLLVGLVVVTLWDWHKRKRNVVPPPPPRDRVFICYRREHGAPYAGRLQDRLTSEFGHNRVFMDLDSIPAGEQFVKQTLGAIQRSGVLLVVITRQWLAQPASDGSPRLFNRDDYVRQEIALAIHEQVRVVPVLVGRAELPRAEQLPPEIAALASFNAIELNDATWGHDTGRLIEAIRPHLPRRRWHMFRRRSKVAAA